MTRLEPGDAAPAFILKDNGGKERSLGELTEDRKLIVFFYPAAMTPGCTKEACDFRDNIAELQDAGYNVVGVSPDTPEQLSRFAEKEGLTYPLLSDPELDVLKAYGAYGEKKLYGKTVTGVIRSTVVIDQDQKIEVARYNVKATGHVASLKKNLGLAS